LERGEVQFRQYSEYALNVTCTGQGMVNDYIGSARPEWAGVSPKTLPAAVPFFYNINTSKQFIIAGM
jgi:hypothetical protein